MPSPLPRRADRNHHPLSRRPSGDPELARERRRGARALLHPGSHGHARTRSAGAGSPAPGAGLQGRGGPASPASRSAAPARRHLRAGPGSPLTPARSSNPASRRADPRRLQPQQLCWSQGPLGTGSACDRPDTSRSAAHQQPLCARMAEGPAWPSLLNNCPKSSPSRIQFPPLLSAGSWLLL